MQHFVIDDLPPADQRTVRKFYSGMGALYATVLLIAVISVGVRNFDSGADELAAEQSRDTHQTGGLLGAVAAEWPNQAVCAARDLKILTALNEHGEAQDVPADDLRNAFFSLVKARKLCSAGDVDQALTLYDAIAFGSSRTAQK